MLGSTDQARVIDDVALDDEKVSLFAWLDCPDLTVKAEQFSIRACRRDDRAEWSEHSGLYLDLLALEAAHGTKQV
jgi:hypothetical protein